MQNDGRLVLIEGYRWPLRFKKSSAGVWAVTRWQKGIDFDNDPWHEMGTYEGLEIEEAIDNFKKQNPGKYGRQWKRKAAARS